MSNPYQPYGPQGYGRPHPQATTVLVLGIVGLVLCPVVSVFGFVQGNRALREIDAAPQTYDNRSTVMAGRVLSLVGLVLWALGLVGLVLLGALGYVSAR